MIAFLSELFGELRHDLEQIADEADVRDLQFIRINGTMVGGLVGVTLHAVGKALS